MAIDIVQREKELHDEKSRKKDYVEERIRNKKMKKKKDSTQETLAFDTITKEGVIVSQNRFTKILSFSDLNYRLAPEYRQSEIFDDWCDIINYFDSSVDFQLLFYNHLADETELSNKISINHKYDEFQEIRQEYNDFLQFQLLKGNNSLIKQHFVVFTVTQNNYEKAMTQLTHIENDLITKFKSLGVESFVFEFNEVLSLLHKLLNPDEPIRNIGYDEVIQTGLTVKDLISPMLINFSGNGNAFKLNSSYNTIGYLEIIASEISDAMLSELLDVGNFNLAVSFDITPMEQQKATKLVKTKMSDLDAMKIQEQKKAVRAGYDMDILPPELKSNINESEKLLEDIQARNERAFLVTITVMATENSIEALNSATYSIKSLCQKYNINFRVPSFQQEEALNTTMPFGMKQLHLERLLTTSSTGIFIPFVTQELFQSTGNPQYYGLNYLSKNMVLADRKQLRNPNGLILGTPGSGKSFGSKREIADVFFTTDDDILIIDPEKEYGALAGRLNGENIELSPTSRHHINPLDININYSDEDDPIALKTDFVTSMLELILGGKNGLTPIELSIISRVTIKIYGNYFVNPTKNNMPILEDLYNELLNQTEEEATTIARGLEMYVTGAFNFFNNQTNIDLDNRVVNFDISSLGKQMKKLAMLIVQDQIWNRVTINRKSNKFTRVYIDEFHLLLKEEQTANYSVEIWKRFRKWGGIPTGLTQNVKDLLSSPEIENIFDTTDFIMLYNQSYGDRKILSEKLNISPQQESYITNSPSGEGLLFYDNITLPFQDKFPEDTKLFKLLSTKPGEGN